MKLVTGNYSEITQQTHASGGNPRLIIRETDTRIMTRRLHPIWASLSLQYLCLDANNMQHR